MTGETDLFLPVFSLEKNSPAAFFVQTGGEARFFEGGGEVNRG